MTVAELIAELEYHDPHAMIVVRGYEGGLEEITHVDQIMVALDVYDDDYSGPHAQVFKSEQADTVAVRLR